MSQASDVRAGESTTFGLRRIWHAAELRSADDASTHSYVEFLRAIDLSLGLSYWASGAEPPLQSHDEDEVYCVLSGKGAVVVGEQEGAVSAGSIVYVPAKVVHRFHSIEESLTIVVFWAPPHHSHERATSA